MRKQIIVATIATILLSEIPFGEVLTYPIQVLSTIIHEMSHGLAALLTGGKVHSIVINPDFSGHCVTSGGFFMLIASAGYLGTLFFGNLIIRLLDFFKAKNVLFMLTSGILASLLVSHSLFGFVWMVSLSALFIFFALFLDELINKFIVVFLGIQLILNSFYHIADLLVNQEQITDAVLMQRETGIPAVIWVLIWLGLAGYFTYTQIKRLK